MNEFTKYIKRAVENTIEFGDTDIFPFPIDNLFFKDEKERVISLIANLHKNFEQAEITFPINQERALQAVGYYGYRWGSQIEPLWNAYFLALVLSIAEEIESSRISINKRCVFSYRYSYNEEAKSMWDKEYNWRSFTETALEKSDKSQYVLKCDISDFYPRIYHHSIKNALNKVTDNTNIIVRICRILEILSKNASYGLPVGGVAARLLSELLLNRVDNLLVVSKINFCRYADDYLIFADSLQDAYAALIILSQKLHENEGLSVQKQKTQIMTSEEYRITNEYFADSEDEGAKIESNFLRLRLFYDPYSPTANEDYDALKDELKKFDIVGMLGKEIAKSRINQALTRRLIDAVKFLKKGTKRSAIRSLAENFEILYPVFPSVMILLGKIMPDLDEATKDFVFGKLRELFIKDSYIVKVTSNTAFAVGVLAHDLSNETDQILTKLGENSDSTMVKRDAILAMAQRNIHYWISDRLNHYQNLSEWERRSLLLSSYILGDEGSHWRNRIKKSLSDYNKEILDWFAKRYSSNGWGNLF